MYTKFYNFLSVSRSEKIPKSYFQGHLNKIENATLKDKHFRAELKFQEEVLYDQKYLNPNMKKILI